MLALGWLGIRNTALFLVNLGDLVAGHVLESLNQRVATLS